MERLNHMRSVATAIAQEWDEDASATLVAQVGRREEVAHKSRVTGEKVRLWFGAILRRPVNRIAYRFRFWNPDWPVGWKHDRSTWSG